MEKSGNKKEEREEKLIDLKLKKQLAKSLAETTNQDEKIVLLSKKCIDFEKDNKRLQATIKLNGKQIEGILREKENLQKDYNKSILMREKLEEVCRELQKITKSVHNEGMQKINDGEERLKEHQDKFKQAIAEVNQSLNVNIDENNKLREYNIEMSKKMKYLTDSNTTREKQLEKINEQVKLESQLNDAKLAKVQMESAIEKEILLREKQAALNELLLAKSTLKDLTDREHILKEQLNIYTSKYDDFQTSLQKSNDMFSSYKTEINKMTKNANKLEKEAIDWKLKWQKCNVSLIMLASEKKERDEYVEKCTRQVQQLQKLLRALQAERKQLYTTLNENNIEPPSIVQLPDEPLPMKPLSLAPAQTDKMDLMAKNCAELKQTLANLQGQMKDITNKQSSSLAPTQPSEQQQKKKKNKKAANKNKQCSKENPNPIEVLNSNSAETKVNANSVTDEVISNDNNVSLNNTDLSHKNKNLNINRKDDIDLNEGKSLDDVVIIPRNIEIEEIEATNHLPDNEVKENGASQLLPDEVLLPKNCEVKGNEATKPLPQEVLPKNDEVNENESQQLPIQVLPPKKCEIKIETIQLQDEVLSSPIFQMNDINALSDIMHTATKIEVKKYEQEVSLTTEPDMSVVQN